MTDVYGKSNETRDALIEKRKQEIIHQRMEDHEIVLDAIGAIQDDNARTGAIDRSLCGFFMQYNRARLESPLGIELSPEHQKEVLDAASSLFSELFDCIYYDVLEEDALAQAKKEVEKVINQSPAC